MQDRCRIRRKIRRFPKENKVIDEPTVAIAVLSLYRAIRGDARLRGRVRSRCVNVGSEAGVKEGDEFSVIRAGEVTKDPDTGEVLGANKVKVGRIKVTAIRGPRLSAAISLSGSGYKSGDVLKK